MAIARVSNTTVTSTSGAEATLTKTLACSGDNRFLFAIATGRNGQVAGVTYNGVAMSLITSATASGDYISLWGLINPATGSNDIVATSSPAQIMYLGGTCYSGVDQSVLPSLTGSGTTSVTIESTVNNSAMFVHGYLTSTGGGTGDGSTMIAEGNGPTMQESNPLLISPAGSKTMNITNGDTSIGVVFIPAAVTSVVAEQGSYALTGQAVGLNRLIQMIAETGSYIVTGFSAVLRKIGWNNQAKSDAPEYTNVSKSETTWTNKSK